MINWSERFWIPKSGRFGTSTGDDDDDDDDDVDVITITLMMIHGFGSSTGPFQAVSTPPKSTSKRLAG